jgi:hypothetical protein
MQASDLVNIHMNSVSKILDILISHSQAGADLEKFLTPSVSFLLDILISHSQAGAAAEDLQPEKVPIKLHVRYLTLNLHCGWRGALLSTWQITTSFP